VQQVVDQQFAVGLRIVNAGLVPILEPEVDINAPDKAEAETLLRDALLAGLDAGAGRGEGHVQADPARSRTASTRRSSQHPRVLRVVALSGGYARDEANARLARNPGVIASFSRALVDGLMRRWTTADLRRDARRLDRLDPRRLDRLSVPSLEGADVRGFGPRGRTLHALFTLRAEGIVVRRVRLRRHARRARGPRP
jgi:hypothetical protein